ncbi:MAG: RNA chaperone Hfq [Paracoccaceae bacterium]|nr:RNA chaperone Hfq [Paracoccaceae bacterium]MDE2914953.1 RNA chaperone Hfq [Paracoccaceae bacterium]
MGDRHSLQDLFLNTVRKSKSPVTVFLVNGVKLQGTIAAFDSYCVLLRRDAMSQLVYKHAVSTIMPTEPVVLYRQDSRDDGDESNAE